MKNRKLVITIVLLIMGVVVAYVYLQSNNDNTDYMENSLIFQGDGEKEISVDIAIQGDEGILYIGNVICKDSKPTLINVLNTINEGNQGVFIGIDSNGVIEKINDIEDKTWKIEIDNEETNEVDTNKVFLEAGDGITIRS